MGEQSRRIAEGHLRRANPSMWDGRGERPADFDSRAVTYSLGGAVELRIGFEVEDGEWTHRCELWESGRPLGVLHGYGVDSPQNLTDTIEDIAGRHINQEARPLPERNSHEEDAQTIPGSVLRLRRDVHPSGQRKAVQRRLHEILRQLLLR